MFQFQPEIPIPFEKPDVPHLLVLIDTEEEFSWSTFSSGATGVANIAQQWRAQDIFNRLGVVPTYLVDYPVATQPDGVKPLKEFLQSRTCQIGAQLHSWVTPPLDEVISLRTTYQCNLPADLEKAKVSHLTQAIVEHFETQPRVFKAGRNGLGRQTASALIENGYTIDNSVLPYTDLSPHGPDFTGSPRQAFWLDDHKRILELPMTEGLVGVLKGVSHSLARRLLSRPSVRLRLPGLLARTGLLERIRLTPEGISIAEAKRLTNTLIREGQRLFVICYHSSSLLPGSTPYVRNEADLSRFLSWLEEYMEFFFGALNGQATTPEEIRSKFA